MSAVSLSTCEVGTNIIICYGPRGVIRRRVLKCHTCERRTPHVIRWDGAYYGTTEWCIACLDGWQDGYRFERPFARYWKRDRAAEIKARWDAALLPAEYKAWVDLDLHRVMCDDQTGKCSECAYEATS